MRIALVTSSFLPAVGGIEWKVHYLATEYIKRGHEVAVFTIRPPSALKNKSLMVEPSYRLVRCGAHARGMGRFGINGWLICRRIIAEHRRKAFDVLHCHHLALPAKWGAAVKSCTGVPVVVTTCGEDVLYLAEFDYGVRLEPRFDRMIRQNVHRVDVIGSVSRAVRSELEAMQATARIVDIPNGVPWDDFQPNRSTFLHERLSLRRDDQIVLSVGRNFSLKRYDVGIAAFGKVAGRFPKVYYVLVGRDMQPLETLVTSLRLDGRVRFVEQVPLSELPKMFQSADVFFNPSMIEGFAQVNAQALACGLPLVITDAPGNVDAADHGGAIVARCNDANSMAELLARLLDDGELRRDLGAEARKASRHYAWSTIADQYLDIFEMLRSQSQTGHASPGAHG
jgi:glycosyltransferase involved in cell wall biosynthesis